MVNVWDGNNVDYVIDANTNRYDSVGGNSLTYDAAGNLTTDKDGYRYEYDYENRIVLIEDVNNADVAEFAYDALGRRIRKIDSIAEETTLYYYNDKWQVLCDYNDSDVRLRKFLYGNYIDEALAIVLADNIYFYSHDHLHSPAALMTATATVLERYEYDAYGNATILTSDFEIRDSSLYDNPYLFTGRRLDILDNGSLKIQYNRNRYYDQYTGRWLTHDPLGITPNPLGANQFSILGQYTDGLCLYEYVGSCPSVDTDPDGQIIGGPIDPPRHLPPELPKRCHVCGKAGGKCGICGLDITEGLQDLSDTIDKHWSGANEYQRIRACIAMLNPVTGWDTSLHFERSRYTLNTGVACCGGGDCVGTVTVDGRCYPMADENYWLWGKMRRLCGDTYEGAMDKVKWFKRLHGHLFPGANVVRWVAAGWHSRVAGVASGGLALKCRPCRYKDHELEYHIGWRKQIPDFPKEAPPKHRTGIPIGSKF